MTPAKKATYAIFGVFFLESMVFGNWIPRIPDIKDKLGLSDAGLGVSLLAIPLGTLIGLMFAGQIIERIGLRRACQWFLPGWAFAFTFVPFANSQIMLIVVLFFSGAVLGLIEVAMNTEADRIEQAMQVRIMSRCHGFWSLGSLSGALCGGLFGQFAVPMITHFVIIMPLLGLAGYYVASCLPRTAKPVNVEDDVSKPLFTIPSKAILLLCIMPMGSMVVEGAFIDWSAVFVRSVLDASPLVISIIYSFFAIVMAAVRLSGDAIGKRFGAKLIVQASGIASAVGIALFALSPNVPFAMFAAAISGMGVAIVYPIAVTASARRPGSAADNVAAITMVSFSAFLVAPPIIGFLSDFFGLRTALLLLVPVALMSALLAPEVER